MVALLLSLMFAAPIEGIAGLPSGALVTWDSHQVYVDDVVVLRGPGEVESVATDGAAIYVVRSGGRFGVRDGGRERWHVVAGARSSSAFRWAGLERVWSLAVRGRNVIAASGEQVFVSQDGGQMFAARTWRIGNTGTMFGFDRAGRVTLFSGQEAGCGGGSQWRQVGDMNTLDTVAWPLDSYDIVIGPKYTYATGDCGPDHGYALCVLDDHTATPVKALDAEIYGSLAGAVEGDETWLLVQGALYVAKGKRVRLVKAGLPTEVSRIAVAGGKVFGLRWDTHEVLRLY